MQKMTRREYISAHWGDCLSFARDILHLHVNSKGRAESLQGQSHKGNEALVIDHDVWFDHVMNVGGGLVELCAYAMFNGDTGRAMDYLCGDFYNVKDSEWRENIERITRLVWTWHEKLLPDDRDYLHSRRINDETIERLKLGSMTADETGRYPRHRLVIPYFHNNRIVYYISRDMTGLDTERKYMKCSLLSESVVDAQGREHKQPREVLRNLPWGLHTLQRAKNTSQGLITEYGFRKRDWLIIAEGAFDAMSFDQEGYCVLATMGGYFGKYEDREAIGWCKRFPNVLVIFDNDSKGGDFQRDMCRKLFASRVNFFTVTVPKTFDGKDIKDVSDYYTAGGDLAEFIRTAQPGLEFLADNLTDMNDVKEFLYKSARYADKSDVLQLFQQLKARKIFNPFWLKTVLDEAIKAPSETVIMRELQNSHTMRYVEGNGFFEYVHGVWKSISDNRVKSYADSLLGRWSTNARMTASMKFAQAKLSTDEMMNCQSVINLQNGILLPEESCRFVMHDPSYLSTIQLGFRYDPYATCPRWIQFIHESTEGDVNKILLLQDIGGYCFWPNNSLEKCFFLIGDGGNGKGVFMDTLREVFGRDNCSALPLSSFGGQFDPIMLQYSLVNFSSETRVDLKGNIESLRAVTSGDDMIAAHKGIDAIKFAPRCKLITSCNDFFNTGDITHALMRRMIFVKFTRNMVQMKKANVYLREELKEELPGILNWCIEGYLRLLERAKKHEANIFTQTDEDAQQKLEFMRTTNSVAFFIEERLMQVWDESRDVHDIYREFKVWAEDNGYKSMSIGAFQRNIKKTMSEMRPEVKKKDRGAHTWLVFPEYTDKE